MTTSPPATDRLLLASAMMGQFITGFASRIFIVALPTIAAALRADILAVGWALIAYQLAGISLSVVFGRMGDIRGRYAIYGLGFAVMAVSSLLCGLAPDVVVLIAFRLLQGVGAAMIASATRVLAMEAMPPGAEGRANGFMTMSFHAGLLLGPPVGGFLIDLLTWRWVFFLLVPVGAVGVGLTAMRARSRPAPPARHGPIDYAGAALLVVLTIALTLLLDRRGAELVGLGSRAVLGGVFALALVAFVARERRAGEPIVNFALFRNRMFSFSVVSLLVISVTTSAQSFALPFYLQDVLHLSPSAMGLLFLSAPVFTIGLAPVSGWLSDRVGPRIPTTIGVLLKMAAFIVGLFFAVDSPWLVPALMMALVGIGTGFFNTPNQAAILGSVPREYRGFATGMVQMVFGVSALLGTSLTGVLLTALFRHYAGTPDATPTAAAPDAFAAAIRAIHAGCLALMLLALFTSVMRGGRKIAPAPHP
jgi:EmrB/QacA subfamily drug resistance transporter